MNTESTQQPIMQALEKPVRGTHLSRRRILILVALVMGLMGYLAWLSPAARAMLAASLLANRLLMLLLVLFNLLALSLLWSWGQQIDAWFFLYINVHGTRPAWLDRVMWLATQIGNAGFAVALAALAYLLGEWGFALLLTFGVLTLWTFVEIVKALTDRARPFKLLEKTRVIGWHERGLSFPSGHTSQTFFVMSLIVNYFKLDTLPTLGLYGIAAFVGLTRMYVGAHYPRDVIAGAVLGLAWALLGILIAPYF